MDFRGFVSPSINRIGIKNRMGIWLPRMNMSLAVTAVA